MHEESRFPNKAVPDGGACAPDGCEEDTRYVPDGLVSDDCLSGISTGMPYTSV